jgi:hypothetical protein
MDFFTVATAMFRVLHVLLVIRHGRRDVVHCAVTTSPTAAWVAQQLRETFPFESAPRFMIFDRDPIFSAGLTATIRSMLSSASHGSAACITATPGARRRRPGRHPQLNQISRRQHQR